MRGMNAGNGVSINHAENVCQKPVVGLIRAVRRAVPNVRVSSAATIVHATTNAVLLIGLNGAAPGMMAPAKVVLRAIGRVGTSIGRANRAMATGVFVQTKDGLTATITEAVLKEVVHAGILTGRGNHGMTIAITVAETTDLSVAREEMTDLAESVRSVTGLGLAEIVRKELNAGTTGLETSGDTVSGLAVVDFPMTMPPPANHAMATGVFVQTEDGLTATITEAALKAVARVGISTGTNRTGRVGMIGKTVSNGPVGTKAMTPTGGRSKTAVNAGLAFHGLRSITSIK
ncbi:hypothetical protein GCM10027347_06970 [Larkinella harenae]